MIKKIVSSLFFFALLFFSGLAEAKVVINEIAWMGTAESQYGEWVELFNDGSSSVDLSGFGLYEGAGDILIFSLSKTIPANGYLVIERTTNSSPDPLPGISDESGQFGGSGLSNSGEFLILKNSANEIVESLDFSGGWIAGDAESKKTMQRSGFDWITASATPKTENESAGTEGDNGSVSGVPEENTGGENDVSEGGSSGNSSSSNRAKEKEPEPEINRTNIRVRNPAFAGVPVLFEIENTISEKFCGKYFFNFGDGSFEETAKTSSIPQKYEHIYEYDGEYIVVLECFKSYLSSEPETSDKITLKVSKADISISRVGDERDFFVEISNNTALEADISGWALMSGWKKFTFPRNSVLKPKTKIIVSAKITNFSAGDRDALRLINSQGEIVFDYMLSLKPVKVAVKDVVPKKIFVPKSSLVPDEKTDILAENDEEPLTELLADNLSAQAVEADAWTKNGYGFWFFVFAVFVGCSAVAVYFIRNYNKKPNPDKLAGDDFEIVE